MKVPQFGTPDSVRGHVLGEHRRPRGENGWLHRSCTKCGMEFQFPVEKEWVGKLPKEAAWPGYTMPGKKFQIYMEEDRVPTCEEVAVEAVHRL